MTRILTGRTLSDAYALHLKPTIIPLTIVLLFVALLLYTCSQSDIHKRADAERALKALDSDVTSLLDRVSDDQSFKSLDFLMNQLTAPVPFKSAELKRFPEDTMFSLKTHKGLYIWEKDPGKFVKTGNSDSVILRFPVPDNQDKQALFVISSYETEDHSSRPSFPIRLKCSLHIDGERTLTIDHEAALSGNLPLTVNTKLEAGKLEAEMHFERTRTGDQGEFISTWSVEAGGTRIVEGTVDGKLGYSGDAYYFETIEPDLRIFDILFYGPLYYGEIDPTAPDYAGSFNAHCNIEIIDLGFNKIVGHFGMAEVEEGDLYDYSVVFSDMTTGFLKDYLLFARRLTDYKYQ